jgi:hypothetical protein
MAQLANVDLTVCVGKMALKAQLVQGVKGDRVAQMENKETLVLWDKMDNKVSRVQLVLWEILVLKVRLVQEENKAQQVLEENKALQDLEERLV